MALKMNFSIEESANAEYFTFTDLTGDYDVDTNPTGWGSPNYEKNLTLNPTRLVVIKYDVSTGVSTTYYYLFTDLDDLATMEITPDILLTSDGESMGSSGDVFEDGRYDFKMQIDQTFNNVWSTDAYTYIYTEGFAAVITGESIREFLSYRIYLDYKTKDEILEKMRLMNNLAYSASIGSTTAFSENLLMLQQLQ